MSALRVLVVDDEPVVITTARAMLNQLEYKVLAAESGYKGLELIRAHRPDIVIADVQMPRMNGLEFLQEARALDPDVVAILITAHQTTAKVREAMKQGAFDILEKPLRMGPMLRAAERAAIRRRQLVQRRRVETLARRVNQELTLNGLFDRLREELAHSLGVRLFSVFLYDSATDALTLACSNHVPRARGQKRVSLGLEGPMRTAITTRAPVIVSRFANSRWRQASKQRERRYHDDTSATLPLIVGDELIGVLNVNDKVEPPEGFEEIDVAYLSIAAEHIASAIAVRQRTGRLSEALDNLRAAQNQLAAESRARAKFIERVITTQEEERRRIARELHDEAGQWLTSLIAGLGSLESSTQEYETREKAIRLRRLSQFTLDEIRRVSRGLRPSALDSMGLEAALQQLSDEFGGTHPAHIDIEMSGLTGPRLPEAIEITLYRAVQEALTNVAKHASAAVVSIVIDRQRDRVRAIIEDDGVGFETNGGNGAGGLGLVGIRERVESLHGSLQIESHPGEGAALVIDIPVGT